MAERMTYPEAQRTSRFCVCSDCWGHLVEFEWDTESRTSEVRCTTENCPCNGFVSIRYVENRKAESLAELYDAKAALRDAIPWMRAEKKAERQLLRELGF